MFIPIEIVGFRDEKESETIYPGLNQVFLICFFNQTNVLCSL